MILEITPKYRLRKTTYNWEIEEYHPGGEVIKVGNNKGKVSQPKWEGGTFLPDVQSCCRWLADKITPSEKSNLTEFLAKYMKVQRELIEKVKELTKDAKFKVSTGGK